MHSHSRLRVKTLVLLILMVLFSSTGDLLLSKGMKQIGSVGFSSWNAVGAAFSQTVLNPTIWFGIACLCAYLACYLLLLSWADYSYVLPASATGYGIVALMGYIFLSEHVSPTRWVGIAIICAGVALVGRTPPRTTPVN